MDQLDRDDIKVQQIRRAASTLFLRHGFGNVSTAALAREAGVSKETLYSRYPNKEAVLADVLEHLVSGGEALAGAAAPPATTADLDHALRSLAHELGTELMRREYVELARIVITETPRLPHVGDVFRRSVPERALRRTADLLVAGKKAGFVRDVDEMTAARMFAGGLVVQALLNVLLVAPQEQEATTESMDVDAYVDLFLAAVLRGGER